MKKHALLPALLCALSCVPTLASDKPAKSHRTCSVLKAAAIALVGCGSSEIAAKSLWYGTRGSIDYFTGQTHPNCHIVGRGPAYSCETMCSDVYNCWQTQYSNSTDGNTHYIPVHLFVGGTASLVACCAANSFVDATTNQK